MKNNNYVKELTKELSILFVDDEPIVMNLIVPILEPLVDKVYQATNGKDALEIYQNNKIDILIVDINIPILNGLELTKKILKQNEEAIIVVITSQTDINIFYELVNLGVTRVLLKPLKYDTLPNILYKAAQTHYDRKLLEDYENKMLDSFDRLEEEIKKEKEKNHQLQIKVKECQDKKNETIQNYENQMFEMFDQFEKEVEELRSKVYIQESKQSAKEFQSTQQTDTDITKNKEEITESNIDNVSFYDTIFEDDLDELVELNVEIDASIHKMSVYKKIYEHQIVYLADLLKMYGSVLNSYSIFYDIGIQLSNLGRGLVNHQDIIKESPDEFFVYIDALNSTLTKFRMSIWEIEANDPTFLNPSLESDIQSITNFLQSIHTNKDDFGDLEDIFF